MFSFPGEISEEFAVQLRELDATHHEVGFINFICLINHQGINSFFFQLPDIEKLKGAWKNFQLKGAAIAASTFAEVLYLDSDNVPLRDPTDLFSDPSYKTTGAVFWPDYNKDHRRFLLPLPPKLDLLLTFLRCYFFFPSR